MKNLEYYEAYYRNKEFAIWMTLGTFLMSILLIILALIFVPQAQAETQKEIIASVIAGEACGEGQKGMALIAEVIANRAKAWHKTPYKIVTAKNQFYALAAQNRAKLYSQCQFEANRLASAIFTGQTGQITRGALYFRQPKEPKASWHKIETHEYKNHIFYK